MSGTFLCADGRGEKIVFDIHEENKSPGSPTIEVRTRVFFVHGGVSRGGGIIHNTHCCSGKCRGVNFNPPTPPPPHRPLLVYGKK